jgi:hypothetical protein
MTATTGLIKTDCTPPSVECVAFAVVASASPAGAGCIQSAFMSGKSLALALRSLLAVVAHVCIKPDSLIPSLTAALISKYSSHAETIAPISHNAPKKIVIRAISSPIAFVFIFSDYWSA